MNLKSLSDSTVLQKTESLIQEENRVTLALLHHLKELERRKLYADSGFSSLFDYLTRGHGYSAGSAMRRISSLRLIQEMPELEEKVQEGKLNLTHLAQAQVFFRNEKKEKNPIDTSQKREILKSLEGKSSREAELELNQRSSNPIVQQEKIRDFGEAGAQIQIMISPKLKDDLEKLRGLLAHQHPHLNYSELIEKLAEIALQKLDPTRKKGRARNSEGPASEAWKENPSTGSEVLSIESPGEQKTAPLLPAPETLKPRSRYILAVIKRSVWQRDQGRCSYQDPKTGRKCKSTFMLQLDHRQDFARGGPNTAENLTLRCSSHNTRHAILSYGLRKRDLVLRLPQQS